MSQDVARPQNTGWRRHWRWAVPGAVAALVAGGVGLSGLTAGASQPLPELTAEELLTQVQNAQADGLSGTVVQTSNLGLPELSMGGSADLTSTLTGTHTWRVWYGGQDKARLSLIGSDGETSIIRNGDQMWTWNSTTREAVRFTAPEQESKTAELSDPRVTASPAEATSELLKAIDPTTQVSTAGTGQVAGRPVYELVLTPRTQQTLVESVRIAVDAEEKVPLRVQVHSTKATDPAFEVGFTSVDFSVPEDRNFQFTPPEGTTVRTPDEVAEGHSPADGTGPDTAGRPGSPTDRQDAPRMVGEGWSAVAVGTMPVEQNTPPNGAPTPAQEEQEPGFRHGRPAENTPADLQGMLAQLPQRSGDWGSGRVLESALFSAIITDDGRYAVGAVPVDSLESALAQR